MEIKIPLIDTSGTGTSGGTGTTNTSGSGTGIGGVSGDPHVVISDPGQPDVCFDFDGANGQMISLLADFSSGLEVNGLLNGPVTHSVSISKTCENKIVFREFTRD